MAQDLPYILYWWLMLFGLGILVFPLTKRVFSKFFDFGYPFAKILAILLLSYSVWLLGSLKILPFFRETVGLVIILLALINFLILTKSKKEGETKGEIASQFYTSFFNKKLLKIFIFEETLFFLALLFWSWVRAHEPSIHGLEKFMDYGFINAILKSKFFPPHDMWLAPSPDLRYTGGFTINYYYFGHLTAAVLTKLSGIDSAITYNLVLANIFALCFTGAFSIGANLFYMFLTTPVSNCSEKFTKDATNKARGGHKIFSLIRRAILILSRSKICFHPNLITFKTNKQIFKERGSSENQLSGSYSRASRLKCSLRALIVPGLLTAFLVTMAGNLHTIYIFLKNSTSYWYPDATRFIPFTIHEFPIYSWVVADLHGHVFDIPFVLLTIAVLLSIITNYQLLIIPLLGFLTAVLYITNALDGLVYLSLSSLVILAANLFIKWPQEQQLKNQKPKNGKIFKFLICVFSILFLVFNFFLFSIPFNLHFHPFIKGIGVNCPLSFMPDKWGPFIFEKANCQKSPLYMLAILWGFFYFNAVTFIIFLLRRNKASENPARSKKRRTMPVPAKAKLHQKTPRVSLKSALKIRFLRLLTSLRWLSGFSKSEARSTNNNLEVSAERHLFSEHRGGFYDIVRQDIFVLLIIFLSTLLLIFPEFFYFKDIYPGHFRANTMFKLGYQAFIMMSIASGYIIIRMGSRLKAQGSKVKKKIYFLFSIFYFLFLVPQLFLISIYPYYAIKSYYNLKNYQGLDGAEWLKNQYPDDYQAILWLKNLEPRTQSLQPVIAEAVGESYTDYSRVSAYTGLPTILGWPVHEWLWRGSYDEAGARIPEVEIIYQSKDLKQTKKMLEKYNVSYVFLGTLEREKYKELNEEKFAQLGKMVFQSGETKIYKVDGE